METKTTQTTQATTINTTDKKAASKPARKRPNMARALTRDLCDKKITCPECGGRNGFERVNQPCDFCGFVLAARLFPDHSRYVRGLAVTKSGRDSYDIADETADTLRGLGEDEVVKETAKALAQLPIEIGLSVKIKRQFDKTGYTWTSKGIQAWLLNRYEGRNPGMVRMNCGNILRAASKRNNPEA